MKKMKSMLRIFVAIALVMVSLMLLVSCEGISEEKKMQHKNLAENLTECIMIKDINRAAKYMDQEYIPSGQFKTAFPQMVEYLGKFSSYDVTGPVGYKTGVQNGISYVQTTYLVKTDGKNFYLEIATISDSDTVCTFRVVLEEESDAINGNSLSAIVGSSPWQIVVLVYGVAAIAFVIWMIADAIKRDIKKKAQWIIVILLGSVSLAITAVAQGGINFNFNLGLFSMLSSLTLISTAKVLRLMFPVGAIIYFIRRKRLVVADNTPIQEDFEATKAPESVEVAAGEVQISADNASNDSTEKQEAEVPVTDDDNK